MACSTIGKEHDMVGVVANRNWSGYCQYPELTNLFHKTVYRINSK